MFSLDVARPIAVKELIARTELCKSLYSKTTGRRATRELAKNSTLPYILPAKYQSVDATMENADSTKITIVTMCMVLCACQFFLEFCGWLQHVGLCCAVCESVLVFPGILGLCWLALCASKRALIFDRYISMYVWGGGQW